MEHRQAQTAIIIAAGRGSRLAHMTDDMPKCLLPVGNKSIMEHQLEAFRGNGLSNIHVIRGYQAQKINFEGLNYYLNDNYLNNNILNSLMYAEPAMSSSFIATYSDIVFGKDLIASLQQASGDIVLVVDVDWQKGYEGRTHHPLEEAEKAVLNPDGQVLAIGKKLNHQDGQVGEFIGMLKCSAKGAETFKKYFHQAKKEFDGKPFMKAKSFAHAYVTDFIQYLIDQGVRIHSLAIEGGWQEIDTIQDIERVTTLIRKESL